MELVEVKRKSDITVYWNGEIYITPTGLKRTGVKNYDRISFYRSEEEGCYYVCFSIGEILKKLTHRENSLRTYYGMTSNKKMIKAYYPRKRVNSARFKIVGQMEKNQNTYYKLDIIK